MSTGDWRLQKHPSAQMGRLGRRHRCDVDRIHEHRHGRQQGRARLCCRSETCNHPTKQLPKYQQKFVVLAFSIFFFLFYDVVPVLNLLKSMQIQITDIFGPSRSEPALNLEFRS